MNLIVSRKGGKHALLKLTERKTRKKLMIRLPNKTQRAVNRALDRLERRYGRTFLQQFKTITVDNGSEFPDFRSLEQSCLWDEKRFKMYFAHPYSSRERCNNEHANGMLRRVSPKRASFGRIPIAKIQAVEDWINNYPRRILGWQSANHMASVFMT
jgi:IS30 family transposase